MTLKRVPRALHLAGLLFGLLAAGSSYAKRSACETQSTGNDPQRDLMLYGTNTVVVFYLTFDSPYSYTRLGRVDDPDRLARVLGQSSVKVEFSRR
jgi:hypothetical protein